MNDSPAILFPGTAQSHKSTNLPQETFGIYIKTFRPDHYLAKALIASIRRYAPDVDITVVPDDGYPHDHIWGEKVLQLDDPFFRELRGYFKKLWVLFGDYDRFLYVDADTLVLRPLDPLVQLVKRAKEPFFFVCHEQKVVDTLRGADQARRQSFCRQMLGDLELLHALDPAYDCFAAPPFPSGFFGSHRGVVKLELLKETFNKAKAIHRERGLPPLNNSRAGLFNGDQGLFNYLVNKSGVEPTPLIDVFAWGGRELARDSTADDLAPYRNTFITWAGCPRPTLLRRSVPLADEWLRSYRDFYLRNSNYGSFVLDSLRMVGSDLLSTARRWARLANRRLLG